MGGFSAWHWIIVELVILVLFGRGKISETMGDFGRGIKSFKKGLGEEETRQQETPPPPTPQIAPPPSEQPAPSADTTATTTDSSSNSN